MKPLFGERASLRRRLAALAYEILLLAAVLFVAGFLLLALTPHAMGEARLRVPDSSLRSVSFIALLAVLAAYCGYFWSSGRRTLAMKTWHLCLAGSAGGDVSVRQALTRYVAAWIGPALAIAAYAVGAGRQALWLLAVNFAWACVDAQRQFLHDRIAGTVLVRERAPADTAP